MSILNNDPISKVTNTINQGKEQITGTLEKAQQELLTDYDGKGRMTGTEQDPILLLANMKIGGFCNFNDKMGEFMERLMKINLNEHNITLDVITRGSYLGGDSDYLNTHTIKSYSYTKDNNYINDFVKEVKVNELLGVDSTRSFMKEEPYTKTSNLYPDDINGAGMGDFRTYDKWTTKNKNSILYKTKQLFNQKKINTIISRFGTNADGLSTDIEYLGSKRTNTYGESHGRNLLKKGAERGDATYNINGYNNPYCRSWTHHYSYDRLNKTLRPLNGGEISIVDFHNWSATNAEFGDMAAMRTLEGQEVEVEFVSEAIKAKYGDDWKNHTVKGKGLIDYSSNATVNGSWKSGDPKIGWQHSVLDTIKGGDGLLRITPKFNKGGAGAGSEANIHTKDCMFSIENLAWKGYDPYSFENALSWEQRGPLGGRIMWFPPYGITFNESTNVKWSKNTFIGRGEDVYTYVNTQRTGNLSFLMVVDHPSIIDYTIWHDQDVKATDTDVDRFFAGCDPGTGPDSLVANVRPTPLTDEGVHVEANGGQDDLPRDKYGGDGSGAEDIDKTNVKVKVMAFFPNNYSGTYDDWAYTFGYLLLGWKSWKTHQWNPTTQKAIPVDLFKQEVTWYDDKDEVNSKYLAVDFKEVLLNGKTELIEDANIDKDGKVETDDKGKIFELGVNGINGYEANVELTTDAVQEEIADTLKDYDWNGTVILAYGLSFDKAVEQFKKDKKNNKGVMWYYRVDGEYVDNQEMKEEKRTTGRKGHRKTTTVQVPTGALKDKKNTYGQRIPDKDGKNVQPNDNYKDLKTFKLNLTTENWDEEFKKDAVEIKGNGGGGVGAGSLPRKDDVVVTNVDGVVTPGAGVTPTDANGGKNGSYINEDKRTSDFWKDYTKSNISLKTFKDVIDFMITPIQFPTDDSDSKQYYEFFGDTDEFKRLRMDFNDLRVTTNLRIFGSIQVSPVIKPLGDEVTVANTNVCEKVVENGQEIMKCDSAFDTIKNSNTKIGRFLTAVCNVGGANVNTFSVAKNAHSIRTDAMSRWYGVYTYVGENNQPVKDYKNAKDFNATKLTYKEAYVEVINLMYQKEGTTNCGRLTVESKIQKGDKKIKGTNGEWNGKTYYEVTVDYNFVDCDPNETSGNGNKRDVYRFVINNSDYVEEVWINDGRTDAETWIRFIFKEVRRITVYAAFYEPVIVEYQKLYCPFADGNGIDYDGSKIDPPTRTRGNMTKAGVDWGGIIDKINIDLSEDAINRFNNEMVSQERANMLNAMNIGLDDDDPMRQINQWIAEDIPDNQLYQGVVTPAKKQDEVICCSLNDFVAAMDGELFTKTDTNFPLCGLPAKQNFTVKGPDIVLPNGTVIAGVETPTEITNPTLHRTTTERNVKKKNFFYERSENKETVKKLWDLFKTAKLLNVECTGFSNSHGSTTGVQTNNDNLATMRATRLSELIDAKFGVKGSINIDSGHKVSTYDHNDIEAKKWRAAIATLTFEVGKKQAVEGSHTTPSNENTPGQNADANSLVKPKAAQQPGSGIVTEVDGDVVNGGVVNPVNKATQLPPQNGDASGQQELTDKNIDLSTLDGIYQFLNNRVDADKNSSYKCFAAIGKDNNDKWTDTLPGEQVNTYDHSASYRTTQIGYRIGWDKRNEVVDKITGPGWDFVPVAKYITDRKIVYRRIYGGQTAVNNKVYFKYFGDEQSCDCTNVKVGCGSYCSWYPYDAALPKKYVESFDFDDEKYFLADDEHLLTEAQFNAIKVKIDGDKFPDAKNQTYTAYKSRVKFYHFKAECIYIMVPCGIKKGIGNGQGDLFEAKDVVTVKDEQTGKDKTVNVYKTGYNDWFNEDKLTEYKSEKINDVNGDVIGGDIKSGYGGIIDIMLRNNVDIMLPANNQISTTRSISWKGKKLVKANVRGGCDHEILGSDLNKWLEDDDHNKQLLGINTSSYNTPTLKDKKCECSCTTGYIVGGESWTYKVRIKKRDGNCYNMEVLIRARAKKTADAKACDSCMTARQKVIKKYPAFRDCSWCAIGVSKTIGMKGNCTDSKYENYYDKVYKYDKSDYAYQEYSKWQAKTGTGSKFSIKGKIAKGGDPHNVTGGSGGSGSSGDGSSSGSASSGDSGTTQTTETTAVSNANNEAENRRLAEEAERQRKEKERNEAREAAERLALQAKQTAYKLNEEKREKERKAKEREDFEKEQDRLHALELVDPYKLRSDREGRGDHNVLRYDQEYYFFKSLEKKDKIVYDKLMDKIKYFDPAFHSMTPEGFNARLTFLNQCTRQGNTISASDYNGTKAGDVDKSAKTANNLAFGRPPYCVLRLGDFYNQMIVINSINIDYSVSDGIQWDMNMEGIGMQPLLARVDINFNFIGGSDMAGPVRRLQNAMTFNYYANARYYDNRADRVVYPTTANNTLEMGAMEYNLDTTNSTAYVTAMRK